MLKRFLTVLVAGTIFAVLLFAQQQPQAQLPPGTASISGTVVIMGTSQPIPGASVEIRKTDCNTFANPPEVRSVITGNDGKFLFSNVRSGGWCIVATAPGGRYTPAEYLQRGVLGRGVALPVTDGENVAGIQLAMAPTGGITGRVLDFDGQPRAFTRVQVMEQFQQDGQRRLYILHVTQTNDRGEYRFYWLPPGRYYVAAVPEDTRRAQVVSVQPPPGTGGRREDVIPPVVISRISPRGELSEETFAVLYYPGETDPERARPIEVLPGVSIGPLDLSLNAGRLRSYHVRGTAVNSLTGKAATGAQLRVVPRNWTATVVMPTASVDMDGNFDIRGVVPGAYMLYANQTVPNPAAPPPVPGGRQPAAAPPPAGTPPAGTPPPAPPPPIPMTARLILNVGNGNVENVKLTLVQGAAISGKVAVDGAGAVEIPRGIIVTLVREPDLVGVPAPQGRGAVQPDGTFNLQNVGPGDYRAYVAPFFTPFQWATPAISQQLQNGYVKAIRLAGRDVLTDRILVTEGTPPGELQVVLGAGGRLGGLAVNERRDPLVNATVALLPEESLRRRVDLYRSATTDLMGRFQIQGIAPGNYRAFAWEQVERDAWHNADFMRPIESRGVAVEIRENVLANTEVVAVR
jgi:hypothetical protein